MVKSIFKRSVALIITLAVSLGFLFSPQPIESQAADLSADIVSIAFPRQNDVTTKGTDTWGHKRLVYANGSAHEANSYTNMQFIETNNNSICYCIEPGKHVSDGSSYTQRGEEYFNKIPNNRLLERDEIKKALGRIFQYGYIGTVSDSWVSQRSSDADKIAHAMATQFLIWEVIVGERDVEFNHVNAPSGYNNVLEGLSSKHPLKSKVMDHYNKIVSSIQNHVGKPSFMAEDPNKAITVELKWNGSNYSATLTDTNNVLSNFNFEPSDIISINGNKLTITSNKYVSNVSITAIKKASTKRSGIVVWEAPTNEQTVATYGAQVSDPIRAYIKVTVNTGMIYGYKETLNDAGKQEGLSGALMGLFNRNETIFTEETALQTCISGQTIPGTTTFHPGGYYFTNVKHGTYLIKEIEAPNGYVLSNETRTVTLNSDSAMVSVSIVNYEKPCSIKGYKVDENANALRGVTFGLFASTETEFTRETAIGICITDANGVFSFDNLRTGKYIVTEIVPLAGYGLNDKKFEVNLTVGGTDYVIAEKIVNEKFYGKIYGYKLNAINDMPLAGAKIGLFNSDSNFSESNAIKVVTTGNDGYFEFSNLEGGKTYWVKELEAPRGFLLSDAVFKRNIDSDEPIEYILYNDDFYVSIQGHKIDENEVGIGGAEIGIFIKESDDLSYYVKNNALYVATTSDDGYFKFDSLSRGTYIIKELSPPLGYKLNNTRYEIIVANKDDITVNTIEADGSVVDSRRYTTPAKIASIDIKIENKPVIVTGTKVDLNKDPLAGAIIGLFNSTETEFTESTALQTFETLSDGTFTFTHVPAGRYYIKEISAPAGFEVSEIKYTLIVTAVGSYQIRDENNVRLTNVEIINLPSPHKIGVTKLDYEGNTLSGAIFLLEWSEDGIMYSPISYTETYSAQKGFTTTNVIDGKITVPESGNITFEGLCPNMYYRVTETKAPDGYNLLKEAAFEGFVSTNDNILVKLDVINTPTFVLPPTGGYANYIVPVSVILSVGIASLAIYLIKKNIERKNKNEKI